VVSYNIIIILGLFMEESVTQGIPMPFGNRFFLHLFNIDTNNKEKGGKIMLFLSLRIDD
jgi:hypothetical protein